MGGKLASNLHEGARSEILADYVLSGWGSVSPARVHDDDHGVDLFCTLMERRKKVSVVTDTYVVQVKSTPNPWNFKDKDEVMWFVNHPIPIFLACVDKERHTVSVYQTIPRFRAGMFKPERFWLVPGEAPTGKYLDWKAKTKQYMSAPIIQVSLVDLIDRKKLDEIRKVFTYWVRMDMQNCLFRQIGILRLRTTPNWETNKLPDARSVLEMGMVGGPHEEEFQKVIVNLVEVVDYFAVQMMGRADTETALFAGVLLSEVHKKYGSMFQSHPRWGAVHAGHKGIDREAIARLQEIIAYLQRLKEQS